MRPLSVRRLCAAMWLALALLCTGCAAAPSVSALRCPALPSPPPLALQPPQPSYSASAQTDIQRWQKALTDTLATP